MTSDPYYPNGPPAIKPDSKPGLYVAAKRLKNAAELYDGEVFVDDQLSDDDWYIITKNSHTPEDEANP